MKKKLFRERYAKYVKDLEVFEEKIENPPKVEVVKEEKPTKRGKKNVK